MKKFYEAWKVELNCEQNDWDDIKCGGSAILGYTFYVDIDRDKMDIDRFLRKIMKDLKRKKFMGIRITPGHEVEELWTDDKMQDCIKENNFG
jgi:hypothetical protein